MEQVYGGYQRSPLMKKGNKATQGAARRHTNAGQIDYYAYGGKVSDDYNDRRAASNLESWMRERGQKPPGYDNSRYAKDWRNRKTWSRVADHLGIDKVDSETELRQMYDFVQGYGQKEEPKVKYEPTDLPEDPYEEPVVKQPVERPDDSLPKPGDFGTDRPSGSIAFIPPSTPEGEAAYGMSSSDESDLERGIRSVADFGNRSTDDYFGRFLPEMGQRNVNEAKATGRSLLSYIQNFQGKVPTLGDPKELFEYYLGKIKA